MLQPSTGGLSVEKQIPNTHGIHLFRMVPNRRFGFMIFFGLTAHPIVRKKWISLCRLPASKLPAKSSQLLLCSIEIMMYDTVNAQRISHLYKHRTIFQVNDFFRRNLGYIKRYFKNICIGFSEMNETGTDKKINKFA